MMKPELPPLWRLRPQTLTLAQIAARVGGRLCGDPGATISGVAGIAEASEGDLTFVADRLYKRHLASTRATAVLMADDLSRPDGVAAIVTPDPYRAYRQVLEVFAGPRWAPRGIAPSAWIDPTARLAPDVQVGPNAVIEGETAVGAGSVIGAGAVIGPGTRLGARCTIYPNVTIYDGCILGDDVTVHAGAVIGRDGFGFTIDEEGYHRIPQLGTVILDDGVEIGSNVVVDRATVGVTRIGMGTKIDNLVQIAHNVTIGEHSAIAGQAGFCGSTRIGRWVQIGGQAGSVGHVEIGDGVRAGAQAGITRSIPAGQSVSGHPARELKAWARIEAAVSRLPALVRSVRGLTRRLETVERVMSLRGKE
jgi:UDP-3-O-[3-hydroxymyristoyl] glucosamine N-acyltransferase